MELNAQVPYLSGAQWLALAVQTTFELAIDVALTRQRDPEMYPIFPPEVDAKFWARRLLGDMAQAGIRPEGWETAFFLDGHV